MRSHAKTQRRKDAKTQRGEEDWDGQNYGAGYLFLAGDTQAERIGNHGVGRTLTEIKPFLIRPLLVALAALLVGLSWVCGSIGRCRRKVGRDFGNSLAGSMGFGRGREPRHPPPPLPRSAGLRSAITLRVKKIPINSSRNNPAPTSNVSSFDVTAVIPPGA
jgi:hypothetical protein